MKRLIPLLFLITIACFQNLKAATDEKHFIQPLMNAYLKNFEAKEHFTGMAVTVFIPLRIGQEKGAVSSFFAGLTALPPPTNPITANTLFEIGSITKSYATAILLQLEGEGKLSLDSPIGNWLPQYKQWKNVTIRHLLNMTSGIPSYTKNETFDNIISKNLGTQWNDKTLLEYANPDKPIPSAQKANFDYSNTNYILAGLIIEKITGQSFSQALEARILKPFQLNNTFYPAGVNAEKIHKTLLPRMAHGYTYDEKTKQLTDTVDNNLTWGGTAGAIVADTVDVYRFVQILYEGKLFASNYRQKALKALESFVSIKTGKPLKEVDKEDNKGFGLGIGSYYDQKQKNKFFFYKGSTIGFRVLYLYSPCNKIITVAALNSKGGEGNPKSIQGDRIMQFSLDLYEAIIKAHPDLACKNL